MKKTEAIQQFLIANTHPDLASRYDVNMEVQVNVGRHGGERHEGEYKGKSWYGWTDGMAIWKSFRIPYNAKINPEYNLDSPITYDLSKYVEGIGMTGWDWVNRVSKWVAFDFDAMIGHSERHSHKLTQNELDDIIKAIEDIEWVELRKSTGGLGLHLYVHLPDVPTANHNEHAALARSIMAYLSMKAHFDFQSKVDICGGNMWVYHTKMLGTEGLKLIKSGTMLETLPDNWQDNLPVITGKRTKIVPSFVSESSVPEIESLFSQLSGQRTKTSLDTKHRDLMTYLQNNGARWWWDADNNMLVCHTYDLKSAHQDLNLRGLYDTVSTGKDSGSDHNCFAFPLREGGWVVRRFGPGTRETSIWNTDNKGWTRCYYNVLPDLNIAARHYNGTELPSGGYHFREADIAGLVVNMLGGDAEIPNYLSNRETKLRLMPDGRLLIDIDRFERDTDTPGWLNNKNKTWQRIINIIAAPPIETETANYDDVVRHLVTETNSNYGWVLLSDGRWREEPLTHVKHYLKSLGMKNNDADAVVGGGIHRPWTIVNLPFQQEYPGDRRWNKTKAQLQYLPVHEDLLHYPTWKSLMEHCGMSLNEGLADNEWAKSNNITTGMEYLMLWLASMIQFPQEPTPYLFFYGPQGSGKSIFHEAINLLLTGGICNAGTALDNPSGFNAEIDGAVLCFTEERNLNANRIAYNRIKEWVTAKELSIHEKGKTPYTICNTTHWMQIANHREYCPVFAGDERIVICYIDTIDPEKHIPKRDLIEQLKKEAAHFTTALLRLEIPKANDRLIIPVIVTQDKREAMDSNMSPIEEFITKKCFYVPGSIISVGDFYNSFVNFMVNDLQLPQDIVNNWTKIKTTRSLPKKFPKGRSTKLSSAFAIGNISFTEAEAEGPELTLVGEFLRDANSSVRSS